MNSETYAKTLKNAYRAIFDLPASAITTVEKDYEPPSHMNNYFAVTVAISYLEKKFKIYHKVYHLKAPDKSLKAAHKNIEHWHDTLAYLGASKRVPLTDDLINQAHIQVKNVIAIYRMDNTKDRFDTPERSDLGRYEVYKGMGEIVTGVKAIIDTSSNEGGGDASAPVQPVVPQNSNLVPA